MHYKLWTKKLDEFLIEESMKNVCSFYMCCLNNIKNKARMREIVNICNENVKFVLIFSACFEKLNQNEKQLINNKYFFQQDSKKGQIDSHVLFNFMNMVQRVYEIS